jgi:hypothetical protein
MRKSEVRKSRRATPWDDDSELTPTQAFLKENYDLRYNYHHRKVEESDESAMVILTYLENVHSAPLSNSKREALQGAGHSATSAVVARFSCLQLGQFLMTINYPSVNGWSIALTCSVMSVF